MRAVFVADGPDFADGMRMPEFDNIHVYPLLARLLVELFESRFDPSTGSESKSEIKQGMERFSTQLQALAGGDANTLNVLTTVVEARSGDHRAGRRDDAVARQAGKLLRAQHAERAEGHGCQTCRGAGRASTPGPCWSARSCSSRRPSPAWSRRLRPARSR